MYEERRSNEIEFMAIGVLLGALLGFVLFVLIGNLTLGMGLGVGAGLIMSDAVYKRRSEMRF